MGLDMYLDAENYIDHHDWKDGQKIITKENKQIRDVYPEMFETGNLDYIKISFEAGYWRKANAIHKWFVDNCQDGKDECQKSYVARNDLKKLLVVCKQVKENNDKAKTLLPPQQGFFFGTYEYDKWYFNDIETTIKTINKCLKLPKKWDFYYHSSW